MPGFRGDRIEPGRQRAAVMTALARYAVPGLLVAVVLVHLYLVQAHALVPWTGGGFAMFSTVDKRNRPSRTMRVSAIVDGRRVGLDVPAFTEEDEANGDLVRRTQTLPTGAAMRTLGAALRARRWDPQGRLLPDPATGARRAPVRDLRLEVWRVRFEGGGDVARPSLIATESVR